MAGGVYLHKGHVRYIIVAGGHGLDDVGGYIALSQVYGRVGIVEIVIDIVGGCGCG